MANKALEVLSPLYGIIEAIKGGGKKGRKKDGQKVAEPSSYKKGGRVRKGGLAKTHKGEMKITAKKRGKKRGGKKLR